MQLRPKEGHLAAGNSLFLLRRALFALAVYRAYPTYLPPRELPRGLPLLVVVRAKGGGASPGCGFIIKHALKTKSLRLCRPGRLPLVPSPPPSPSHLSPHILLPSNHPLLALFAVGEPGLSGWKRDGERKRQRDAREMCQRDAWDALK